MKKILSFFLLILGIFFLVGCAEIISVGNDFINETSANKFIYSEEDNESEDITNDDTSDVTVDESEEHSVDAATDSKEEDISEDNTGDILDEELTEATENETDITNEEASEGIAIDEDGTYTDKDSVALYIHTYGKLPSNYITKSKAQEKGWNNKSNTMAEALPGMSIGGDHFGNYESLLPKEKGRTYKECDIDYEKGGRNAKRIIYSNDGLIFYTEDHYASFEQLY